MVVTNRFYVTIELFKLAPVDLFITFTVLYPVHVWSWQSETKQCQMAESIEWKSISTTNETDYNPSFLEFNFKLLENLVF